MSRLYVNLNCVLYVLSSIFLLNQYVTEYTCKIFRNMVEVGSQKTFIDKKAMSTKIFS